MQKHEITAELVTDLVADQFPHWAHLPVKPVEVDGWDNCTFRLGESMSVRLPSADAYVAQIDKEHRWLPALAPHLPLPIPTPIARAEASDRFPRPWSVYGWLEGEVLSSRRLSDVNAFARDLATFLNALYQCDRAGPPPGAHSFWRGGPVATWDAEVREAVATLGDSIDREAVLAVWEAALAATPQAPPVWVHGDVASGNLLVRDGRLAAIIDFGCSSVGDPACDLVIAWRVLRGDSREVFKALLEVDDSVWTRARGWAVWKPLLRLARDHQGDVDTSAAGGIGGQSKAGAIVAEVIAEHRRED